MPSNILRGFTSAGLALQKPTESSIMKKILGLTLALSTALSTAAFAAPTHERVRGTVTSIDATTLVVHTATGDVSVALTPKTHFLQVEKASLSNIEAGSYIGTATKSVGPLMVALEVVIFPPAMKGTGDGHYAWDKIKDTTLGGGSDTGSSMTNGSVSTMAPVPSAATTNSSMTNGSVAAVASQGGAQKLTVTYKGGQQTIIVPPTAPIVTFKPGMMSDVTTGATVFVNASKDGDTVSANAVAVGVDGATPPM
jgi:hypothetical protein